MLRMSATLLDEYGMV